MNNQKEMPLKEKYDVLQRRYNSLALACQKLELKLAEVKHDNQVLRNQLLNADQQIGQQKTNLINVVATSNQVKDTMASEISGLRAELRKVGNGDNHRLGN